MLARRKEPRNAPNYLEASLGLEDVDLAQLIKGLGLQLPFSVTGGQFGFNITAPTNAVVVVEASTNLLNPVWSPVSTNTLTGGASSFSDPQSSSNPRRFYRFRSP